MLAKFVNLGGGGGYNKLVDKVEEKVKKWPETAWNSKNWGPFGTFWEKSKIFCFPQICSFGVDEGGVVINGSP